MRALPALVLLLAALPAAAQTVVLEEPFPALRFSSPVDLQAAHDGTGRLYVVEQAGRILVFDPAEETPDATVFLDIEDRVSSGGEMGLLGLAFHPDHAANGYFFVHYTAPSPRRSVVARFERSAADPSVADPASEQILLEVEQPFSNHNAGQLQFGPDGYLYIGMGDGGDAADPFEHGQNPATLLGSILRIDVDGADAGLNYAIPPDNPFVGDPTAREEIWLYGVRNPWRFSFGPGGVLWIADVGQGEWEEISWGGAGLNLGWNTMEGPDCFDPPTGCDQDGLALPVHWYPHDVQTGGFSITGGYVYQGSVCEEDLTDRYIFGDYVSGNIWAMAYDPGGKTAVDLIVPQTNLRISTFGQDEGGEIYVVDHGSGTLWTLFCDPIMGSERPGTGSLQLDAFPNPAGDRTTLRYRLERPGPVVLEVYDVLGRQLARLVEGVREAGEHDAVFEMDAVPSGVYLARLQAAGAVRTVRFVHR